jgi:hypothetical protein
MPKNVVIVPADFLGPMMLFPSAVTVAFSRRLKRIGAESTWIIPALDITTFSQSKILLKPITMLREQSIGAAFVLSGENSNAQV